MISSIISKIASAQCLVTLVVNSLAYHRPYPIQTFKLCDKMNKCEP